jgi:hypothetical protein
VLQKSAYTGRTGEKGRDVTSEFVVEEIITFKTTRVLQPREGLTIAVAWSKGVVTDQKLREKVDFILKENVSIKLALTGLILLAGYYFFVLDRGGKRS